MAKDKDTPPGNGDGNGDGDGTKGQPKQVTMTQDALNSLMGERADRAAKAATSTLLAEIGFEDNLEGLKEALTGWKAHQDGQRTELEKAQSDLEASQARVATLEAQLAEVQERAETFMLRSSVISAARDAEFLKESLEDVWLLVSTNKDLSTALSIEDGAVGGSETVVKKVAEMRPHWIAQKDRVTTPPGRSSSSRRTPSNDKVPEEEEGPLVRF